MDGLRIDPTNAYAVTVGNEHGLAPDDLAALERPAAAALRALVERFDPRSLAGAEEHVLDYAASVQGRFRSVVVLALGHAAAANAALRIALNSPFHNLAAPGGLPGFFVLDDVDPDLVGEFLDVFDPSECLFVVLSRSGDSPETIAQFLVFREHLVERLGAEGHKDHVAFVTHASSGSLRAIAQREGYVAFDSAAGPLGHGSALGPDALLAAALVGMDVKGIAAGAAVMFETCAGSDPGSNPALQLAMLQRALSERKQKRVSVALACSQRLRGLAEWSARLAGEALGLPASLAIACDPVRVQNFVDGRHDAWFTLLAVDAADHTVKIPAAWPDIEGAGWLAGRTLNELSTANRWAAGIALARAHCPSITIRFPSVTPHAVGQFLALSEMAASIQREWSGARAGPGNEITSDASALLDRVGFEARRGEIDERRK